MNKYTLFICGGNRDGEILGEFSDSYEAMKFGTAFMKEHEHELIDCGLGIEAPDGSVVDWETPVY